MVKLQFSIIKKRYKNGRRIYQYERISLVFPREFQDLLRQLRHRQLKIKVTRQNRTTNIVLIDNEDP